MEIQKPNSKLPIGRPPKRWMEIPGKLTQKKEEKNTKILNNYYHLDSVLLINPIFYDL